jgi:long-chain acyl-CoA synthetase
MADEMTDGVHTKLESVYRSAPSVANICIYASPLHTRPIAIIVPLELSLKKLAGTHSIPGHGLEDWIHDAKIKQAVLKEVQSTGRAGGLAGIEIVQDVVIVGEEWNPMNVSFSVFFL